MQASDSSKKRINGCSLELDGCSLELCVAIFSSVIWHFRVIWHFAT